MAGDPAWTGFEADATSRLGKLVRRGAWLEALLYDLAEDLLVSSPRKLQASGVAKEIRRQVERAGLPPWAGSELQPERISAWCDQVITALDRRNTFVHAVVARTWRDGQLVVIARSNRADGAPVDFDLENLSDLADHIQSLLYDGMEIWDYVGTWVGFRVSYRFWGRDAGVATLHPSLDGTWERPTSSELETWVSAFANRWRTATGWPVEPPCLKPSGVIHYTDSNILRWDRATYPGLASHFPRRSDGA